MAGVGPLVLWRQHTRTRMLRLSLQPSACSPGKLENWSSTRNSPCSREIHREARRDRIWRTSRPSRSGPFWRRWKILNLNVAPACTGRHDRSIRTARRWAATTPAPVAVGRSTNGVARGKRGAEFDSKERSHEEDGQETSGRRFRQPARRDGVRRSDGAREGCIGRICVRTGLGRCGVQVDPLEGRPVAEWQMAMLLSHQTGREVGAGRRARRLPLLRSGQERRTWDVE